MDKSPPSPKEKLDRMNRPFTFFLAIATVFLFFGDRFLSAEDHRLAFGLLALIFVGFWLYGVVHMPAAISEQLSKSHHPDEDVRALQNGEISIREYAERKAAKEDSGKSTLEQ